MSVVVWFTGLPSSGKSTLAERAAARLRDGDVSCCVLDGDAVRGAMVPPVGYDPSARDDFYATLANLAALLAEQGLVVLVPATAHRRAFRARARQQAPRFVEVHVDTSLETCRDRDAKGLYAQAAEGALDTSLPGAAASYEAPEDPDVVAAGGHDDDAIARLLALVTG